MALMAIDSMYSMITMDMEMWYLDYKYHYFLFFYFAFSRSSYSLAQAYNDGLTQRRWKGLRPKDPKRFPILRTSLALQASPKEDGRAPRPKDLAKRGKPPWISPRNPPTHPIKGLLAPDRPSARGVNPLASPPLGRGLLAPYRPLAPNPPPCFARSLTVQVVPILATIEGIPVSIAKIKAIKPL